MATKTVSNAGGNWNATATWTLGVVPVAGDDIAFTVTSGNLTVNVASAALVGVNFTNYLGTITFNNVINTSGFLNLGTGGYTQAGASGITLNGTATLTSGGVTWSRPLTFGAGTYTLADNWTVTGLITFSSTNIVNGNTLNIGGILNQNSSVNISGTTTFLFNGTGSWNCGGGIMKNNVNINTPSGTLTITGTLGYDTGTFTYTAGTVITNSSTLSVAAAATFNTGTLNWNNLTTTGTTYTITLSSNLNITGTLTLNHSGTLSFSGAFTFNPTGPLVVTQGTTTIPNTLNVTNATLTNSSIGAVLNTNTINISGNLSTMGSGNCSGTTSLVLTGTGTWNNTTSGIIRNNLTINAAANTITVSGNVRHDTGTLTYTSGTINTALSTLTIGANTTLNTNGITWNNITTSAASVITLGSNLTLTGNFTLGSTSTTSFVLGGNTFVTTNANLVSSVTGTFTVPTNLTFKSLTVGIGSAFNGNTLTFTENLTINNGGCSGTTNFVYAGTGTWTGTGTGQIRNNFTINTPTGILTLSGAVWKELNTITYTAGTINETAGYLVVGGSSGNTTCNLSGYTFNKLLVNGIIILTSNINATTFGTADLANTPISFTLGIYSLNFTHLELRNYSITTLPTAWVAQNVELVAASSATLNANSITITGNFTQSGVGLFTGTTTFTYSVPALSTGTWSRTGIGRLLNNFTVNSAGTINFTGGIIGGGIFTYTAGTFNCQVGSTLYNNAAGTTFNGAGINWYNVVFGGPTGIVSVTTVALNTQLICLGTLTLQNSDTNFFSGTDGTFDTYNLIFGTNASAVRITTLLSTKTYRVRQSFICTQSTDLNRILLKGNVFGSQAIFTVDNGATIDVGFVNTVDINSSLGRPIYDYKGSFTNTLNWGLLPVDNTRSNRSTFVG